MIDDVRSTNLDDINSVFIALRKVDILVSMISINEIVVASNITTNMQQFIRAKHLEYCH